MDAANVMKHSLIIRDQVRERDRFQGRSLWSQFATTNESYVILTSVYVPYTCRNASQISPTVA
jgi:hypothetical protein